MNIVEPLPKPNPITLPGLPRYWGFWLWQLVPLLCVIIVAPPAQKLIHWPHLPFVNWLLKQKLFDFAEVTTLWIELIDCQIYLLAFWLIGGQGRWYWRCVISILLLLLIFEPMAIWLTFFGNPKTEFAPVLPSLKKLQEFSFFFGPTCGIYFVMAGIAALFGWRFQTEPRNAPQSSAWQFTTRELLLGMLIIPLLCGLSAVLFDVYAKALVEPWLENLVIHFFLGYVTTAILSAILVGIIASPQKLVWQVSIFLATISMLIVTIHDAFAASIIHDKDFRSFVQMVSSMTVLRVIGLSISWFLLSQAGLCLKRRSWSIPSAAVATAKA